MNGILKINQLLVHFSEPRFDLLEIVRESLDLSRHRVEASTGISLDVLNGLFERAHRAVELIDIVGGLFDESLLDGMFLRHLGLQIFLPLQEGGDVALQFDHLSVDRLNRLGPNRLPAIALANMEPAKIRTLRVRMRLPPRMIRGKVRMNPNK